MRFLDKILLVTALLCWVGDSYGQATKVKSILRHTEIEKVGTTLTVSLSCPEVFSAKFRKGLSSGFSKRVLFQFRLMERGVDKPVAQGILQYVILYDLWEERFMVNVEDLGGRKSFQVKTMDELVTRLGTIERAVVLGQSDLAPNKKYRVVVRVLVNPASPSLQKKLRTYVANPHGPRNMGTQPSFIGRFAGVFVPEKDIKVDAQLKYRSSWKLHDPKAESAQ